MENIRHKQIPQEAVISPAEALLAAAMRADAEHYNNNVKRVLEVGIAPQGDILRADDVLVRASRRKLEISESIFSSGYAR
jgi:hypothetical protein